ncbi:hypothetical protein K8089_12685 [Aequorivita sp. F47161]|uniref:Uncharacterized protein n=1 Tax=Aequorivita vitellina TaxID=2874475 RepID=A0A9X1R0E5_9FLAO|nr:hypothetical protein [Aequorivita vitellina]MCG2419879.1 hypothetical protein [Aequorivita vitellina]
MILYRLRKKIKKKALKLFFWIKIYSLQLFAKQKTKQIYIDISDIDKNRYLANFIKFFNLLDYTIYIPNNSELLYKLKGNRGEFKYTSGILRNNIKLGRPRKCSLTIEKEQLSNDYFTNFLNDYTNTKTYYIPMSMYPDFYKNHIIGTSKFELTKKRNRSIIMAGNFDKKSYTKIENTGYFEIPSRSRTIEFLKETEFYEKVKSQSQLDDIIINQKENKLLLIDTTKDFKISMYSLPYYLSKFDFYLALPGIEIPHSHNLIEAMAVSCIPIIHSCYAALFNPPLKHQQEAFVFLSLNDLDGIIKNLEFISELEILTLRKNSFKYYEKYLNPSSVVEKLESKQFNKIYIQAEKVSLELYNGSMPIA